MNLKEAREQRLDVYFFGSAHTREQFAINRPGSTAFDEVIVRRKATYTLYCLAVPPRTNTTNKGNKEYLKQCTPSATAISTVSTVET